MPGHYLRVQEAASLLGVAPPTIRWYCGQGMLPAYWIGRGQTGHRRFLYADVARLGKRLGRIVPAERAWDPDARLTLREAAEYLGLSDKFLVGAGFAASGAGMSWAELKDLERAVYGDGAGVDSGERETGEEGGESEVEHEEANMRERHGDRRPGHHARRGPGAWWMQGASACEPWQAPARWRTEEVDPADLLALKSAKRHLEARRADLEDQIAELTRQIENHPDFEG